VYYLQDEINRIKNSNGRKKILKNAAMVIFSIRHGRSMNLLRSMGTSDLHVRPMLQHSKIPLMARPFKT